MAGDGAEEQKDQDPEIAIVLDDLVIFFEITVIY